MSKKDEIIEEENIIDEEGEEADDLFAEDSNEEESLEDEDDYDYDGGRKLSELEMKDLYLYIDEKSDKEPVSYNSKHQTTSKRIKNFFNNILFTIFIIMSVVYPLMGILIMADAFSWTEYSSDIEWSTVGYGIVIALFILIHSINSVQRKSISKKIKHEKSLIRSRDDKEFLPVELEFDDFNIYFDIISNKDKFVNVDKFPQEYINNAVKYNMIIVFQSDDKIPDNTESCDMFLSSSYTTMIVLKDQNLVLRKLFNFMKKHERRERNR